jgi:type VI secretion system secreted protein Hcp
MKRALKYAIPVAAIIAQGIDEPAIAGGFLKIDDIEGESIQQGHEGEIDVLAWSWGVSNGGLVFGSPGGTKSSFTPIKIIKSVDAASADLIANAVIGQPLGQAVLSITRPDAKSGEPVDYLTITLDTLIVSKVAHGGKSTEPGVAETITLDYTKIKVEYDVPGGGTDTVCWDREQNKSC